MLYKITYTKIFKFWHESKILPKVVSEFLYGKPVYEYDDFSKYVWISTTDELQPRLIDLENENRNKPYSYICPLYSNKYELVSGSISYKPIKPEDYPSIVELKESMSGSDYLKMLAYYSADDGYICDDKSNTGLLEEE